MKKEIPSTFILNGNDVSYFFVEGKHSKVHGPLYYVYYDSKTKPVEYNAENFVEVHGLNSKEKIIDFTKNALLDLTVLHGSDSRVDDLYNTFQKVYQTVSTQDAKRPKLGKLKKPFIDGIAMFNDLKELVPGKLDISYEEDYLLVSDEKKKVRHIEKAISPVTSERKQVKQIVTGYENNKGVQRKLKYD